MAFTIDDHKFQFHIAGWNTASFQISDLDEVGSPAYYGFVGSDGHWIIMKKTATAITYAGGTENYGTYWTLRDTITYARYDLMEIQ